MKMNYLTGGRANRPYEIVATSPDAGIIEAIPDTVSLDALKKARETRGAGVEDKRRDRRTEMTDRQESQRQSRERETDS